MHLVYRALQDDNIPDQVGFSKDRGRILRNQIDYKIAWGLGGGFKVFIEVLSADNSSLLKFSL